MPKLEITLLGTLTIALNGKPLEVTSNFVRALLVFLVIEKQHPHRREVLAEMLWPGKPEGAARNSLKQALSNLRMVLGDRDNGDPFLLISGDEIQFNQSSHYWVDAETFTEIIYTCDGHQHDELSNCEVCRDCYRRAVDLYQGDFLAGFYLPDNQDFNDWVTMKREVFQRDLSVSLSNLVLSYEGRGELTNAIEYSRQLTDLEPWNEENHRNLMRLLALNGMRSAALRHYQVCCESLRRELDVEPSNATTALYEEIKAWEPGAFPDPELPQISVVSTNPNTVPEPNTAEKSIPIRKLTGRSLLWLIAAGLILGIGSVYWSGLPKRFGTTLDLGEQGLEQNSLDDGSSTQALAMIVTEEKMTKITSAATQVPTSSVASSSTQTASNLDSEADIQALTTLYQQTGGSNWENADGWLSERSPCEWYGITCRGTKIVTLNLSHNQLDGTIPAEIGQLGDLEVLDLGNNQLDGNIPSELGDLSRLKHLTLSGNRELSGPIPPELGNLSNLEFMELAHWESGGSLLSGEIPPELGNLKKLRSLSISVSLLNGPLPIELLSLTNLEDLHLDSNRLSGPIPSEIGNMTSLGALDLGGNDFEGPIPPELGNLAMLDYLALGGSLVSGQIPDELGNLVRLRHLVLDNTGLSGPLPMSLMNLDLRSLTYFGTSVCEPADEAFQAWLGDILDLQGTQVPCESQGY